MRQILVASVLTAILFGIGSGCSESRRESTSPVQGNLDAALAINDSFQRDQALVKVAAEAAAAKDVEVARRAVRKINDSFAKDNAAAAAALKFAAQGSTADATEIAKLISDSFKRDQTLAAIANTPVPSPK